MIPTKISVVVTTYNWPHALRLVLNALVSQRTDYAFEIIIADDGSQEETAQLVRTFKERSEIPILHIWQADTGFRAATIRNKAALAALGDYLIFLDGDCIPRNDFIQRHAKLAKKKCFVVGNRVLLSANFTLTAITEALPLHTWSVWRWCLARLQGHCNRVLPFVQCNHVAFESKSARCWRGAKGCNLGMWRDDLQQINGWEEKFSGWGYEDSDLVIRLLSSGIKRKSGRFQIPVIHLWHKENDRTREADNLHLLNSRKNGLILCAEEGLNQYE